MSYANLLDDKSLSSQQMSMKLWIKCFLLPVSTLKPLKHSSMHLNAILILFPSNLLKAISPNSVDLKQTLFYPVQTTVTLYPVCPLGMFIWKCYSCTLLLFNSPERWVFLLWSTGKRSISGHGGLKQMSFVTCYKISSYRWWWDLWRTERSREKSCDLWCGYVGLGIPLLTTTQKKKHETPLRQLLIVDFALI